MLLTRAIIKILSRSKQVSWGILIIIMATFFLPGCGQETISLEDRMQRALNWQSEGDLKSAVIELKNALLTYPDSQDVRFLLGRVYLELGMGFAAEKEIEKAGELGVDENIIILPLVESWLLQNKFDQIIETISYEPDNVTPLSLGKRNFLGAAHLGKGEITISEGYFEEVLKTAPGNMRSLVGMARISFIKKDIESTDKYIALAEAILPNDQNLLKLRAGRSWVARDFEAVEIFYRKLVEYYPSFYINEVYLAWVQLINGKNDEAEETLIKFRKLAPENGLVNYVSGLHAILTNNYPDAKKYAEKALIKAPGDSRTKFIAATATFALGENEQSYAYVQQYLEAFPDDLRAKELMARLQVRMDKKEDAYSTVKDISDQAEKKERFLNMLASYELQKGDIEQARLHLEQSLRENPEQVESRQKLALMKITEGEIEEGLREMERALAGVTDEYKRIMIRAKTLIIASRYTEALENCRELQKIDPKNANGHLCEGTALYKKGEIQQALPSFLKVLAKDPGNLAASRLVTAIHLKNNALKKAQDVQLQYLKIHPRDAQTSFSLYMLKSQEGRKEEAIEYLKKSVEFNPNARLPVLVLARHYLSVGKADKALDVSDKIIPLFPKASGLHEVRGKAQLILKRFGAAERSFEILVKENPKNMTALALLASAYDSSKNYIKLEKVTHEILSLEPESARAQIYLALIEASRGKWQNADNILSKVAGNLSNDVEYNSLRGRINLATENYDKAIYFFDKSFQIEKNTVTLLQLTTTYRLSGKIDTAANLMEEWHRDHPEDMTTTASLGDLYLERKNYQKANEKYALILERHPGQSDVLNNLAWSLYKMDKLDEALFTIREAREISPDVAVYLDTEGEILLARKEVSSAVRQYRKAVDNAPDTLSFKYHLVLALIQAGEIEEATELLKDLKRDGRPFEGRKDATDLLDKLTTE